MRLALPLAGVLAGALLGPPKTLAPARTIKAAEGYFDELLAIDEAGRHVGVIRTDGATFAKVEVYDVAAGGAEPLRSFDIPDEALAVEALYLPPDASGVVLVSRDGGEPGAGLRATLMNAAGRVVTRVGPVAAFGRAGSSKLLALEKKARPGGGPTTYVVTPYALATLAAAGKAQAYDDDADGLARAQASMARTRFAALMQNGAGVDIVDLMGERTPAALAVPFGLYDPKSLRDQEGPEPGALWFSLSIDTVNAEAIKRRKPDLPTLDLYCSDRASGHITLRARVFTPRPVTWLAGHGKLALVKRRNSRTRGGDELQIYDLR
jgi:hypothetical protein